MEIIRKKICLESGRNRIAGNLPYFPYNVFHEGEKAITVGEDNTNYGGFLADFDSPMPPGWEGETVRASEMMRRYHGILDILRNGVLVTKRMSWLCPEGAEDNDDSYIPLTEIPEDLEEENCNGFKNNSLIIRQFTPHDINEFTVGTDNTYRYNGEGTIEDRVNIIEDYDRYERLGGIEFVKWVDELICNGDVSGPKPPYFEISLLLTQDTSDLGVMTDYEEDFGHEETKGIAFDLKLQDGRYDFSGLSNKLGISGVSYSVESKLQTLRTPKKYYYKDGLLPGNLVSDNNFYSVSAGEVKGGGSKTTTATDYIVSSFRETLSASDSGTVLIKYKNEMTVPFEEDLAFNVQGTGVPGSYIADYIESSVTSGGTITFKYRIGANVILDGNGKVASGEGGILYEETYLCEEVTESFNIEGADVPLTYTKIDYDSLSQTVYSPDLGLYRSACISEITDMPRGDAWKDGSAINAPVYKEEYMMGQAVSFNAEINVDIDRGSASAFEKHFKLSECNTFSDLENYGNNYFFEN